MFIMLVIIVFIYFIEHEIVCRFDLWLENSFNTLRFFKSLTANRRLLKQILR